MDITSNSCFHTNWFIQVAQKLSHDSLTIPRKVVELVSRAIEFALSALKGVFTLQCCIASEAGLKLAHGISCAANPLGWWETPFERFLNELRKCSITRKNVTSSSGARSLGKATAFSMHDYSLCCARDNVPQNTCARSQSRDQQSRDQMIGVCDIRHAHFARVFGHVLLAHASRHARRRTQVTARG